MPIFKTQMAFRMTQNVTAFLNLEAGLIRGEVLNPKAQAAEPERNRRAGKQGRALRKANRQLKNKKKRIARLQKALKKQRRALKKANRQLKSKNKQIARLQKELKKRKKEKALKTSNVKNALYQEHSLDIRYCPGGEHLAGLYDG